MISVLLMHLCVAAGPHPCDSVEVYAVASWEGPESVSECEAQRRKLVAQLTPRNQLTTRFECESESTEVSAVQPTSLRF
jgi:hypothetical protein